MAYIHARRDKNGNIKNYRLVVSDGLDWKGKQRRRYSTWTPPNPGMSEKQMEKLANYLGYSVSELFTVEDKFKPLSDKTHHRLI